MLSWLLVLNVLLSVEHETGRARQEPTETRPDVVVVAWNSAALPLDTAATAASEHPSALQRLARSGGFTAQAHSPAQIGRPTLGTLLCGLHPHQSGAYRRIGAPTRLPDTLPELLGAAGYWSLAIGRPEDGATEVENLGFSAIVQDPAQGVAALEAVPAGATGTRPIFVWWAPEPPRRREDNASELGAQLELLVQALERRHRLQDTLFVLASNAASDRLADEYSDSAMRRAVFLSIPAPGPMDSSPRALSFLDLYPTILDCAGVPVPPGRPGRSLRQQADGTGDRDLCAAFFEQESRAKRTLLRDLEAWTIHAGRWKYVLMLKDQRERPGEALCRAGDEVLFDLQADPGEELNLVYTPQGGPQAARLRSRLADWWSASGGPALELPYTSPPLGEAPAGRPNIVLVISDDQDAEHLGFMGHPGVRTPTLDALARSGVVFPTCHVPMSRCRPTHAALLSGRWPHQTRVYDNQASDPLPRRDSLPNLLKAAGYAAFMGGKLWEGPPRPLGFLAPALDDRAFVRKGQDELFAFIDEHAGERPFFIWWSPWLPHTPHNPPDRLTASFEQAEVRRPPALKGDVAEFERAERTAFAMGAWLDEGLTQLCDKLKAKELFDDTLFVFLIDNGLCNGFPSKGTAYEKGLRTPLVFSWPKGFQGGRTEAGLVSALDVPATILEVAGAAPHPGAQGASLLPVLQGKASGARPALHGGLYHYQNLRGRAEPETDMFALYVRDERWKYVLYLKDVLAPGPFELKCEFADFPARPRGDVDLFDLAADPYERSDVSGAAEHQERLTAMRASWLAWWRSTGGGELDLP